MAERTVTVRAQFIGQEAEQARNRFTSETRRDFSRTAQITQQAAEQDAKAFQVASLALKDYQARFDPAKRVTQEMTDKLKDMGRAAGLTEDQAHEFAQEIAFLTDKGEDLESALNKSVDKLEQYEKASRSAGAETKGAAGKFDDLRGALGKLGIAFGAVAALRGLQQFMSQNIELAIQDERATLRLENALRLSTRARGVSVGQLQDQAQALARTTGYTRQQIQEVQALLVTMGANEKQLDAMTRASLDFSAAQGRDVVQAALQVGKTLSGLRGELNETVPGFAALTAEQLRSGAAADKIAESMGGAAERLGRAGASAAKYRQELQELRTDIGRLALESFAGILDGLDSSADDGAEALAHVTDAVADMIPKIREGAEAIGEFIGKLIQLDDLKRLENFISTLSKLGGTARDFITNAGARGVLGSERSQEVDAILAYFAAIGPTAAGPQESPEALAIKESLARVAAEADRLREALRNPEAILNAFAAAFPIDEAQRRANEIIKAGKTLTDAQNEVAAVMKERARVEAEILAQGQKLARLAILAGPAGQTYDLSRGPGGFEGGPLYGTSDELFRRDEIMQSIEDDFDDQERRIRELGKLTKDTRNEEIDLVKSLRDIGVDAISDMISAFVRGGGFSLGDIKDRAIDAAIQIGVSRGVNKLNTLGYSGNVPTYGPQGSGELVQEIRGLRQDIRDLGGPQEIQMQQTVRALARIIEPERRTAIRRGY